MQAITKFESLANQVQKNASDIEERLHVIESVRLFKQPPPKPGEDLPEAKVRKRKKKRPSSPEIKLHGNFVCVRHTQ